MRYLLLIFLFLTTLTYGQEKRRIIVLTDPNIDIRKETDDAMSLVRLMVYSNEFDIEGLIATCSHNMEYRYVKPIHDAIDAYELVLPNLRNHADGYPSPNSLRAVTALGPERYATQFALNEEPISPGAEVMINAINKDDDRPIWVQIWGDGAVIAQVLEYIRNTEGQVAVDLAVSKLRILDLAGQDDSGAWLMGHYPDLWYIRWVDQYVAMDPMSDVNLNFYPQCGECAKGDPYYTNDEWVANNVQNHGPLGDVYPDRRYLKEGDTPTMLYMIPNGLNNPNNPWEGSWGGRTTREPIEGLRSYLDPLGPPDMRELAETDFDPYYMYGLEDDRWTNHLGNTYTSTYVTIFRWWEDFQNDFASRMDWSIQSSYNNANHPPEITNEREEIGVFKGDIIYLSSLVSDPDGDLLNYKWWYYKEPGTYSNDVIINNSTEAECEVSIPIDAVGSEIHIILSVTDNGTPVLTRYKRVIINVYETFIDIIPPSVPYDLFYKVFI